MRYSIFLVLIFLAGCGPSTSLPDGKESAQPYFWEVEKEGKVSYWLGTIHLGVALHEVPCSSLIQERLEESDLVFTEIGTEQELASSVELLSSPKSKHFKSLNSKTRTFLKEKGFKENGSYLAYGTALTILCFKEGLGFTQQPLPFMDTQITAFAQLEGIPIQALDNQELLSAVHKTYYTKKYIEKQVDDYPKCFTETKKFVSRYKTGQLKDLDFDEDHVEVVLKNRNEKWVQTFKSSYKNHNQIFVAVGQAHLAGPYNVLDMLKEEGFSAKQVSCSE